MALEEISFYNVNGDEVNLSNLVEQAINYYEMKLEVGETRLTDFNEGSEIRNLLEAFAVLIFALMEEQYESTKIAFIQTSYGTWLDRIGENPFINLPRIEGDVSKGTVTFTLATAQTEEYVIPDETILLSSETGLEFATVGDCIINATETSAEVYCECLTEGVDGNVGSGSIDTINDSTIDTELVSVTNAEAFEDGSDYEDDDDYRQRLLENVQSEGFGTIAYYTKLGNEVDGVHDVKLVSDATYTKKVLVNGYTKPVEDSVLAEVLTAYSNLDNIVIGHSFIVDKPTYQSMNLTIDLEVSTLIDEEELQKNLLAWCNGTTYNYVEFPGLNIEEKVTQRMIVDACASWFENVVSVTAYVTGESEPFDEIVCDANSVLKIGTIVFNQTEV